MALADEQNFDLIDSSAHGDAIFHHDVVVKQIGAVQTMLVSYWSAGYVKLNVNDPTAPQCVLSATPNPQTTPTCSRASSRRRATPTSPSSAMTTSSCSPRTRTSLEFRGQTEVVLSTSR